MVKVRFAPSPTGSLHVGSALSAVANRSFADEHGGTLLLRIDDTDAARSSADISGILTDLDWLGVRFEDGPVHQTARADSHRAAAERLRRAGRTFEGDDGALRFDVERRPTLLRADGSPTYHLASVVDDIELGITHVIRGNDHRSNTPLHVALAEALGAAPPEYRHHGLLVGDDGQKLSKREAHGSLEDLRAAGMPAEAVRRYLDELGLPRGDVHFDLRRLRRLAVEAIGSLTDEELAARVGAPPSLAPALRGARDLAEAEFAARSILEPEAVSVPADARPTLERFRELRDPLNGLDAVSAREIVRELKAIGGDLRAVRQALTGRESGPELWAILAALDREETLRRIDAAL